MKGACHLILAPYPILGGTPTVGTVQKVYLVDGLHETETPHLRLTDCFGLVFVIRLLCRMRVSQRVKLSLARKQAQQKVQPNLYMIQRNYTQERSHTYKSLTLLYFKHRPDLDQVWIYCMLVVGIIANDRRSLILAGLSRKINMFKRRNYYYRTHTSAVDRFLGETKAFRPV